MRESLFHKNDARFVVADALDIIARTLRHGCSDHHCKIQKKTGMGTNGGCKCHQITNDLLDLASFLEEHK